MKPFRFGVGFLSKLTADGWAEQLRHIEALGYSSVFWPDHFTSQWEPVATLAAAAAVTKRLRIGSLVFGVDFRHPVVLAKAAATIHLLSGGRFEFGIGAGAFRSDYDQSGIPYNRPSVRIERLDEALEIIRHMWTQETTSFSGKHYQIKEIPQAVELPEGDSPRIIVGGGGRKILTVAGRHADIVSICPSMRKGKWTTDTLRDCSLDRFRDKIRWVRNSAEANGRNFDEIELNTTVFTTIITDDPKPVRETIANDYGLTDEEIVACPGFLIGSAAEIRERIEQLRNETGISYIMIWAETQDLVERFAEAVVDPLTGK